VRHHTAAPSTWKVRTAREEDIVACSVLGQLAWLAYILECLQLAACQPHQQPETLHKSTSILLAVKRCTLCTSILLAVERDTPCTSIVGGGERDAQSHPKCMTLTPECQKKIVRHRHWWSRMSPALLRCACFSLYTTFKADKSFWFL
jgi:hypothetical protein